MTRPLVLAAMLAVGALLMVAVNAPPGDVAPRFPPESSAFAIDGWRVGEARVEGRPGVAFVSRDYERASDRARATLVITTSAQSKLVYRAGADVPLLGSGFTVESLDSVPNRSARIARRGAEAWLQIATFGERRGAFGNGPLAWSLSVFDTVLGRSNNYYLARILVPYTDANRDVSAAAATELADTLFPRLAKYYED